MTDGRDSGAMDVPGLPNEAGIAAEVIEQLKPLLLEQGLDPSRSGQSFDSWNAALEVAIERHNFGLFVPVGAARQLALEAVETASLLLWDYDFESWVDLIDSLDPDQEPTPAHVTGVTLSLLDSWFADESVGGELTEQNSPAGTRKTVSSLNS